MPTARLRSPLVPLRRQPPPTRAAVVAGVVLGAVYAATAARTLTFWDAGEFLAGFHVLGIPHPPGTPLFVLLGAICTRALGTLGPVLPASLLAAACSALAGAIGARLVARWTGSTTYGIAAALCAGATSSVWLNATEAEVYAPALLLAALMLLVGDRAGTRADDDRSTALLAYLFGLAPPLHLSALVAAPTAALLAAMRRDATIDWRCGARLLGLAVAAAGIGTMSRGVVLAGVAIALGSTIGRRGRDVMRVCGALALVGLAATALLVLVVRARHEPLLDQGAPSTWRAFVEVVARRQYAVAPLWPRRAPWWLQVANVGEWGDWQFALGLDGEIGARLLRTPFTMLYLALGAVGARELRARDRRAWRATASLLLAGSLGVAAYLNLRAGPSFGIGVLPDGAVHEARERDYFFVLAFWTWGLWAGIGAVVVARRVRAGAGAGVALAALPVLLNWSAVTRRRAPDADVPHALATALLASVPRDAVLLLVGDNDSYPVWFVQLAEARRRDVTPITIPLLGAPWYRDEIARRHALLPADARARWVGLPATLRSIAEHAAQANRPMAIGAGVPDSIRRVLAGRWTLAGLAWVQDPRAPQSDAVDTARTAAIARMVAPLAERPAIVTPDGTVAWAQALMRCPTRALTIARESPGGSLDGVCNSK